MLPLSQPERSINVSAPGVLFDSVPWRHDPLCAQHTLNNSLKYTDPTGHFTDEEIQEYFGVDDWDAVLAMFGEGGKYAGQWGWLALLHVALLGDNVSFASADGSASYRGKFKENDQGNLMLQSLDEVGIEFAASDLLITYSPDSLRLNRPIAVDLPGTFYTNDLLGEWNTRQQYPYLRSVNWDLAGNPLIWDEVAVFGGATLGTLAMTGAVVSAGVAACATVLGCVGGAQLIVAGGGSGLAATGLLAHATRIRFEQLFDELTVWGP